MIAMNAFEGAAGVSPAHLSLLIRTGLFTLFFIWAAWSVYSLYHASVHSEGEEYHLPMRVLRVLLLCSIIVMIILIN